MEAQLSCVVMYICAMALKCHGADAGSDASQWISNRDGPVPDSELLSLLDQVKLSGEIPLSRCILASVVPMQTEKDAI